MLSWLRREQGQELLELALVFPVLLLLIFGTMQLALVILAYNTVGDAAREGARLAVVGSNAICQTCIETAVYRVTDAAGLDHSRVTVAWPVRQADIARVEVTYDMLLILPVFGSGDVTLRAVSVKLIELD